MSFIAIESPGDGIKVVLKNTNSTYYPVPSFVQTPACGYDETWSYAITWDDVEGTDFATLHTDTL